MRSLTFTLLLSFVALSGYGQSTTTATTSAKNGNIYTIKELFLEQVMHNPTQEADDDGDNELTQFNRWFHLLEPRTYPDGNLPSPDALMQAQQEVRQAQKLAHKTTSGSAVWKSLGPSKVPSNYNGIGRVNCIVFDPNDTGTLFIGTACGGVWISHNSGATWYSNSDNFPSLSIADVAVNPKHSDTIYAATGDGYGYENGGYNIFWGGLYSAGIMMSADTGHTWSATGLTFLQSDTNIVQKLLIHPKKTGTLLAATRYGLLRSTNAGTTWTSVATGHIYSMAFRPGQPDTVYAVNNYNLIVSYNAGATWTTLYSGINSSDDRCSIAVSPASPNSVWILNPTNTIYRSYNGGHSFTTVGTSPSGTAHYYGYYDRVLAVSPTDSNFIITCGKDMAKSPNGGISWSYLDNTGNVHVDNHAIAINPLNTNIIYTGNDGGIACTRNGGFGWRNLANGLTISQIYRLSSSRQDPSIFLCGVQDNGSFYNDGSQWLQSNAPSGDGMDNAIFPGNDDIMVSSWQYGHFYVSTDHGGSYNAVSFSGGAAGTGPWITPVAFNPRNADTIYFGFKNIYASYDAGTSANPTSTAVLFTNGATAIVVAPSAPNILYACDNTRILRSSDAGVTWTNISAGIPGLAKTGIAVDYKDPNIVYLSVSGYAAASKVFKSTNGGSSWTSFSTGLPNVPANCIATDSTTPGALFVGTDMGVFYRDDSVTSWSLYNTGLPNVIVDDIDINYTNYMVRAATYGRGVWECRLKKDLPPPSHVSVGEINGQKHTVQVYPNPTTGSWKLTFVKDKPAEFTVKLMDVNGKVMFTQANKETIDASGLANGNYFIEVSAAGLRETIKAVKN